MEFPKIIVNLKTYQEATGKRALEIAKAAEKVFNETGVVIGIAPQFVDIRLLTENVSIPILAQHMDPIEPGAYTGHILPISLKDANVFGVILNHSERQLKISDIEKSIKISKELGFFSVVCANNNETAKAISMLKPDAVAVEPPELIGTGVSVSQAKPEIIKETVESVDPDVKVYVGAGISTKEDIKKAIELGAFGILLASAVAKSKDPYKKLKELAEGLIN